VAGVVILSTKDHGSFRVCSSAWRSCMNAARYRETYSRDQPHAQVTRCQLCEPRAVRVLRGDALDAGESVIGHGSTSRMGGGWLVGMYRSGLVRMHLRAYASRLPTACPLKIVFSTLAHQSTS
jgi:hypothetical protein